jgi:hypothetical protein
MRAFLLTLLISAHAYAQEAPPERPAPAGYDRLIEQALTESASGRWAEARVLFRRAHELFPNARTLRGIGMVAYELGDYPDAIRNLRQSLGATERALTEEQREQATTLLTEALTYVGSYDLANVPEGAAILVDGLPAEPESDGTLLLRIGPHEVVVTNDQHRWEGRWSVVGGENAPIPMVFDLPPVEETRAPPPVIVPTSPDPAPAWAVTISGAAIAIVGIAILIAGVLDVATIDNAVEGTEWNDISSAYDRAPILTTLGPVVLGIGAAAAIGGSVWIATLPSASAGVSVRGSLP